MKQNKGVARSEVINKLRKSKSFMFLFSITLVVLISSGVYAIWLISFQGTTGFIVDSTSTISISSDFSLTNINDTSSEVSKMEFVSLINADGDVGYVVDINSTTSDLTSDNCDSSGDGSIAVVYDGIPVSDGSNITVGSGTTYFNVTTTLAQFSCPQNFTTEVILIPQ